MSGAAGEYAKLYNSYLEPPLEFFYMSYLTCLGSAVADKLTVDSEISPQPRLYTLILGESADDRKSRSITNTLEVFKDFINVCNGVGSAEGLMGQLKDYPKTLLHLDEFKQFVSKSNIQSSVLLPCVSTLFEDNEYSNRTKHTNIAIYKTYLSLLAASTIETYERTWEAHFTDIGFNNRLFLVPGSGERKSFRPRKIPIDIGRKIAEQIGALVGFVGDGLVYEYTNEADDKLQEWYMDRPKNTHHKRLDGYAFRLTCLLALNEKKSIVDIDIANKVIDLVNWEYSVRQTYDPIYADTIVAKMEEKIRRQLISKGALTTRELQQYCHANRSGMWCFKNALNNLKEAHDINSVKNGAEIIRWVARK